MNLDNRNRKFVLLKYLFSVMAMLMVVILFFNFFTLLTNPGDLAPSDLLVKPVLAQDSYGLDETAGETSLPRNTLSTTTGKLIGAVLSLVGVIFLALMVYGGILWMTARGNEEQVKKARDIIIAAVVGIIIVIAAYAITSFIMSNIADSNQQQQGSGSSGPGKEAL